jgi:hypothetical protein
MGWAFSPDIRGKLTVQALLNHAIIGEAVADLHRADLAAVGMGDGNCGYHISFYQEINPLYLPFVTIKLEGCDVDLPRATISGFSEYFTALYRAHPVSGRHRTVFGGLWTDRIDAVSMLNDRVAIGLVSPDVGNLLADYIQSGFLIVEGASPKNVGARPTPGGNRPGVASGTASRLMTADPSDAIVSALQSDQVIRLLHPILEGHPLALGMGVAEGDEAFRQASAAEALSSPNECLVLVVPLDDSPIELEVVRDSHLFPEFSSDGQSRWVNPSSAVAIEIALRQQGMVDQHTVEPGSVAIVGPGLIHRIRTKAGAMAWRVHCTPSRIAPLDRLLDGTRKEITLESGARIWM